MVQLRPNWLPDARTYSDPEAVAEVERAYDLAYASRGVEPDERTQMLTEILLTLGSDAVLVATGLLIWPWREEQLDKKDIIETCGQTVYELLQGVDALQLIDTLHEQEQSSLERLRKMLLAMANDMRAVILKLALQVVAMRRIEHYTPQEQQRLALQTRDLFAPLANRMGIAQIKWELEDSALHILEPDIYQELTKALNERLDMRNHYIRRVIDILSTELKKAKVPYKRIYGRAKHINSIYQKMKRKGLRFEQLNDVRAVRVEVETQEQCYQVLSILSSLWKQVPEEFDDYIAHPKANGYQSLHVTLIGPDERILEVQIRTTAMHEQAELGMAAHWMYKEKGVQHSRQFEHQIEWLRRMLEGAGDTKRGDIVFDEFRNEAFRDRVYTVTPQGKVVDLPEGATPLDFAYQVHTQLGHRCRGAKVNGQMVPLTTPLKNGDTVEVLTQKDPNPSMDWLSDHLGYLQSARAKAKVRSFFKKREKEKSVESGRELLTRELRRLNLSASDDDLREVGKKFNVHSDVDLYAGIGFGDISVLMVAHEVAEMHQEKPPEQPSLDERIARIPVRSSKHLKGQNVIVEDVEDMMINFATCCHPVPPCRITGFVTLGRGVNIHRSDCPNVIHLGKEHPERIINVRWNGENEGLYAIDIGILSFDRPHVLRDMTQVLSNERITIVSVSIEHNDREQLEGKFTVEVNDMGQLSRVIDRLSNVKDVINVRRL